jgi:hypothetical protein
MERLRAGLSLAVVGRCFRRGISAERVRQIEASRRVTSGTLRDYRAAIKTALAWRAHAAKVLRRVRAELGS